MKKAIFLTLLLSFSFVPHYAHSNNSGSGKIVLKVKGTDVDSKGQLMVALHNTKKTFLKKTAPYRRAILPISGEQVEYTFEDIPFGTYSIAVFQDDNKNMDLDLGKMFKPKEKYGFSNNARGKFGPPGFDKTTFELNNPNLELEILIDKP